ncbi:MAG: site-specific integrase [Clostridiales bacterium]|jgi:integrase|nr:site-specific integrase [Clostridiales bacterium]
MAKSSKREDGRYQRQILIERYSDKHGDEKRIVKTVYGKTLKELDEKEKIVREQIKHGIINSETKMKEWALKWLAEYKKDNAQGSIDNYRLIIEKHIIPAIGSYALKDIKPLHVQAIINNNWVHPRNCEYIRLTLRQIFNAAIENDLIIDSPARFTRIPTQNRVEKTVLSKKEIDTIKKSSLDLRQRAFVYILLFTGVRRGECLALSSKDFHLGTLIVNKAVDAYGTIKLTKTPAGMRILPIKQDLQDIINALPNGLLFPSAQGVPMNKNAYRSFWDGIVGVLGFKVNAHKFRHTYCTALHDAGIDVKVAQVLMGHTGLEMTLGVYTHADKQKIIEDSKLLNLY